LRGNPVSRGRDSGNAPNRGFERVPVMRSRASDQGSINVEEHERHSFYYSE
jgi:hypothetical protein